MWLTRDVLQIEVSKNDGPPRFLKSPLKNPIKTPKEAAFQRKTCIWFSPSARFLAPRIDPEPSGFSLVTKVIHRVVALCTTRNNAINLHQLKQLLKPLGYRLVIVCSPSNYYSSETL